MLSMVDYSQEVEENPYLPLAGFIPNDHDGRHFYPVFIKDSHCDLAAGGSCTMMAPFIQYLPDFTKVTGMEGVGFKCHTVPVYIGRRSRVAQKMMTKKWR